MGGVGGQVAEGGGGERAQATHEIFRVSCITRKFRYPANERCLCELKFKIKVTSKKKKRKEAHRETKTLADARHHTNGKHHHAIGISAYFCFFLL